ncbi:MAG TPA: cytochrome c biogenesis protein CcdA [Anaerolineales bacterium]|nr:cytochrome c biogenesis protein CcdA [Anaerolineales bacterium]
MDISGVTTSIAFFAGIASFLSPCVFALVPAYVGYLGGRSAACADDSQVQSTLRTLAHGLAFVLGFSFVFTLLGLGAAFLGSLFVGINIWLPRIGGIIIILFGLHMTRVIRIPLLDYDLRPQSRVDQNRGYLSSAMMGVFFSAGWSPCVGPILGLILTFAINGGDPALGFRLLAAYSAGLGIPFLLAATQVGWVTETLRKHGRIMHYVEIAMGVLMIGIGVLLFIGQFERITGILASQAFFFDPAGEAAIGRNFIFILLGLMVAGLVPAWIAKTKGRNFLQWWFFAIGLFPIALPAAFVIKASGDDPIGQSAGTD